MRDKKTLTRADLVRQRRQKEETRRKTERVRPVPTVTRRSFLSDTAAVRTPKMEPVRRYPALAATPAVGQLRAPALPRFRVGWRWLSFFLVAFFGAAVYFAWTLPLFRVGGMSLAGNQILSAEEVNTALKLNGAPIFLLVPADLERALWLAFPEITSVKVTVALPNRLTAVITERQPLIRWWQDEGVAWVDAEGVAIRPRGEREDLVTVRALGFPPSGPKSEEDAPARTPFVEPSLVEAIRVLAPYVPQGSVLLYDPKYGLGWLDGRGWTVWFGASALQMDMKLRVYTVLVDSLAQRGISPVFINVAYPNAPYYRLGQ